MPDISISWRETPAGQVLEGCVIDSSSRRVMGVVTCQVMLASPELMRHYYREDGLYAIEQNVRETLESIAHDFPTPSPH